MPIGKKRIARQIPSMVNCASVLPIPHAGQFPVPLTYTCVVAGTGWYPGGETP
jgi:uncharacterized membrane protein